MTIFNVLSLIGGLALFLYGMEIMGSGLEKLGGGKLERILERLTSSPIKGVLLGFVVTGIIQSSSATTVMVVGFVNSGIMKLSQAIGITMGANIGTTVTAWILSLSGIKGDSLLINLCKPENFTPILAIIGVFIIMMSKSNKKKNTANILLGFTVLMFGMSTMSSSVEPLKDVPEFTNILIMFENPILGVLAGMVLTAIIQSSSASVGILQALSATGAITFGSAIPIILGQNIGTCITVVLSAIGTSKNAKRAAAVHLYFNVIGTVLFLSLFYIVNAFVHFSFLNDAVTPVNIAVVHTLFNLITTAVFLPFTNVLEKLAKWTIKDGDGTDMFSVLDEKYFQNPQYALDQSTTLTSNMAYTARETLDLAIQSMTSLTEKLDSEIIENETQLDDYEDALSKYLVRLSARTQSVHQSRKVTMLLHAISEFEQMTDYETNILYASRTKADKGYVFSDQANAEMDVLVSAVRDIMDRTISVFVDNDVVKAFTVEPLADVIDALCEELKKRHISRMQQGVCTVETGILFTDYVAALEKISYHCKNTAAFVIQMNDATYQLHSEAHEKRRASTEYKKTYEEFRKLYALKYIAAGAKQD
ncbi:MAG TPA: Na/Pi cotransporter family protein [Candidatus Ornithomonoglobus merdipullorum]|uniref:Na/Pi cotransporter family protein n=1 Tax=Candidatus Ornithomonoglobus merdipullorum TaxID=2840895 RepID=A0A9D1MDP3_9FIRM|nr:Na/Pi cotransporter family protein [Candidatus Ornithomonoglobus merdipullorum]